MIPRKENERGSGLVEYAIVLVAFLMLLFGIIDFGRALYAYHFLSGAAREATRWAAVNGLNCGDDKSCNGTYGMNNGPATKTQIESYVSSHLAPAIDSTRLQATASWPVNSTSPPECKVTSTQNSPGCTVDVLITYNFNFLTPLISTQTLTLSSESQMVISH